MVLAVGPGGRPALKTAGGKLVTRLAPGRYKVSVRDRVATRGVRLSGAGAAKATTKLYVGVTSWSLRLRAGTLRVTAIPVAGQPVTVTVG